jgi:hypothetical protein
MRSVDPIDVPPYLWTIKAIWTLFPLKVKKEGFTLHGAMQNDKPKRAKKAANTYTNWLYGNADFRYAPPGTSFANASG